VAHIPDGFLSIPVLAGTAAASATALTIAAHRSRATLGEREGPVLGATTAFVFAAQMLNFPLGIGASAHLLGAALVAVLLGPAAGMLVMFAVLLVQALLFQDGGIAALGANTFNIAVLGVGSAAAVFGALRALLGPRPRAVVLAAAAAAGVSTALVGGAVSLELALSGLVPFAAALTLVGGGHVLVGLAEAALTGMLVSVVLRARPEVLARHTEGSRWTPVRAVAVGAVVLAVMALAVVAASSQPDVLEAALERFGLAERGAPAPAPFPDYVSPAGGPWVAGAVGLLAAFLVAWGVAIAVARRRT
jgi:cobalt/nickel transport system permease protein